MRKPTRIFAVLAAVAALAAALPTAALAKHGADDPVGHISGGGGVDDGSGHR